MIPRQAACAVVVCVVALASAAGDGYAASDRAAAKADGRDPDRDKAKAAYERGVKLFNMAEYERAIQEFKQAYELSGAPELLFNIAQSYRLGGDCKQAARVYKNFLREAPATPKRPEAEAGVAQCEKPGDAASAGAGSGVASTTDALAADPGASGAEGGSAPGSGSAAAGATAATAAPVDQGEAGRRARWKRIAGLALAGAGVAALGVGIAFGLEANQKEKDVHRLVTEAGGTWNPAWDRLESDGRQAATAANWLVPLGAAAAVGGAVLVYLGWPEAEGATPAPPAVSAAVHPGGFSLVTTCAF